MAPSASSSSTTSVQVALRIRPPTNQDAHSIPARFQRSVIQALSSTSVSIEVNPLSITSSGTATAAPASSSGSAAKRQVFTFDQVHGPPTTQYELFTSTAQAQISRFLDGFNCTIVAYGQTSSGKTHTMTGIDLDADPSDPQNGMGIIPRAVSTIFARANQTRDERAGAWNYSIKGSFIEIYNEDLIDLLSYDDLGGRREVQIREDKDGTIIWGGLREVSVRNASEVMTLIRKGTSIRRTNETDMNAQSSRSHAIFSLTLTQKKYTGSNPLPRSSSPLPPSGRSPSRLTRPGSMYASGPRVSSPTLGRPGTPNSFAAAMGRGGLRPSSALGHAGDKSVGGGHDDEPGEWVTIVSKFHFVDLAGSERLKRTAAAGERIKEGISINSGLLALGNVISALGDPSRAKAATHIPYRDSKLTRLLQDSLGGNAHTLMIACVSPAEYNAAETINTLKYANRARNIKNRAVVNEKEEGWDDVEWLQGMVTRLRKEMKGLKDGGITETAADTLANGTVTENTTASKRVLSQFTELQSNYEDLRAKFVDRTEELTRLRREVAERQRLGSNGATSGTARYEEIVGPVIEEYEKTISAMEAELSLNRVALQHTNELVEEKEEAISSLNERHAATELYVEELKSRASRLSEREASTEAYIRDLEEKMRTYDETSVSSSESLHDLKREVARFKDAEAYSSKYITDLEARLARSDESVLDLQRAVERLEKECERRRDEVENLQSRLDTLRKDGASWHSDLEERERRVKELEQKMEGWEEKRKDAGEARIRLGVVVGEVASARRSLEIDLANKSARSSMLVSPTISPIDGPDTEEVEPTTPSQDQSLRTQLDALQQTHSATLADLTSVTAKYRDALREITDLAAQIQEAKLAAGVVEGSPVESQLPERALEIPFRRRMTGSRSRDPVEPAFSSSGRRLFFREAASAESLHLRSLSQSQSLSQELSSVHLRKGSSSSHGSHSPSASYSPPTGIPSSISLPARPNLSISLPSPHRPGTPGGSERSVASLENEIMRLQEVLKEREAEITSLESSLKEIREAEAGKINATIKVNGDDNVNIPLPEATLSPKRNGSPVTSEPDESLERLNELMLSMAQKESHHREVVDDLNTQLTTARRQLDELTTLSRDQALNMSTEIEALRAKHEDDLVTLQVVREREAELVEQLNEVKAAYAIEIQNLREEHEKALHTKCSEVDELITSLKQEHDISAASLREDLATASAALEAARREHNLVFGKLKADHDVELQRKVKEAETILMQVREEHQATIIKLANDHAETLRRKVTENESILHSTEEEYYDALTKLRTDHAEALKTHAAETNATIERLKVEHAAALRMAEIAREGKLSESESTSTVAIQNLQTEHDAAIERKEAAFLEERQVIANNHARLLHEQEQDYMVQINKLRSEHEISVSRLKEEWRQEAERLTSTIEANEKQISNIIKSRAEVEDSMHTIQQQQVAILQELERAHDEVIQKAKDEHQLALQEVVVKVEKERDALASNHQEELDKLRGQQSTEVGKVTKELEDLKEIYVDQLKEIKLQAEQTVQEERGRGEALVTELAQRYAEDSGKLRQEYEVILAELEKERESAGLFAKTQSDDQTRATAAIDALSRKHADELEALRRDHQLLLHKLEDETNAALSKHDGLLKENERLNQIIEEDKERQGTESVNSGRIQESLTQEIESLKATISQFEIHREQERHSHETTLAEQANRLAKSQEQILASTSERDLLEDENAKLRAELDRTRNEQSKLIQEASKRASLVEELEHHRSALAEIQENIQKVKDEKDVLQTEKARSENLVRDLQAQLARSASPPNARTPDRALPYSRANGLPHMKLPPPTPPPTIPPPPAPRPAGLQHSNSENGHSVSSHTSSAIYSVSSKDISPDSPSTSIGYPSNLSQAPIDAKTLARLEQQAKTIDEQEAMIKTLNKQLTHCESDLQTHMDLVGQLEARLGDSEKNLRKARMHATELARERDTLNGTIDTLRHELDETKREMTNVRQSIVEEKRSLKQRLDEERKDKERVRQQLDSRTEELQKRKSKYSCL